ncbi:MAG: DUF1735 domain-containing protein [Sphingobacteriaceae bacterium]|nr:MAG: DUF1735 domain-containing protein [Sphingobacteriaceae bacterium]
MKKNILKTLSLLLTISCFTSCLKDDSLILDPAKGTNVVEFANPKQIDSPVGSVYPLYSFAYNLGATANQTFTVSYSGPVANAPQDITVNLGIGTAAQITAYNTQESTSYAILPPTMYTLNATSVVIKAGTSKASFTVTYKPDLFSLSAAYVLPLTITSASTSVVSGNFGTIFANVGARNNYEGNYLLKGRITRNAASGPDPALSGVRNGTLVRTLTTLGQYQNAFQTAWGNNSGVAGIDGLNVTVDPVTKSSIYHF